MGMSESMDNMKPTTAEDIFRILREFMQVYDMDTERYSEQAKVWDVLTALRGPDNLDPLLDPFAIKQATTAVIRGKLLGMNSSAHDMADMQFLDSQTFIDRRKELDNSNRNSSKDYHFTRHAQRAFEALHLNWEENNGKVDVQPV